MNEKFFELAEEKQLAIINAGFEVFGSNEYKKASTELMAQKAGISKGLLFYYFKNKREFYFYLIKYACDIFNEVLDDEKLFAITDFFDFLEYAATKKQMVMGGFPYITEFIMKMFYSKDEDISKEISDKVTTIFESMYKDYLKNIDFSKFKESINPQAILEMLTYLLDGYLYEQQRVGIKISWDEIMQKYRGWAKLVKEIAYKEEYT